MLKIKLPLDLVIKIYKIICNNLKIIIFEQDIKFLFYSLKTFSNFFVLSLH